MIVLDIESSGIDTGRCGIWQIGAIELENIKNYFLQEGRIDDEDITTEEALKVTGKTKKELRDRKKQSQKQLMTNFFDWVNKRDSKNFLCQNPQFDVAFIDVKATKYNLNIPYHHRSFDLHSIAQSKYYGINKQFLIKEGHSDMGLSNILKLCNMKDERVNVENGKIIADGRPHNALEDCKLTAECFSRLIYGKNLFPEYKKFKIPEILKK